MRRLCTAFVSVGITAAVFAACSNDDAAPRAADAGPDAADAAADARGAIDAAPRDGAPTDAPAKGDAADLADGSVVATAASATIGPEGGKITLGDVTLVVPANALDASTTIVVRVVPPPSGFTLASKVYAFEPATIALAVPALVTIATAGSAANVDTFASRAGAPGFDRLGATVRDGAAFALTMRLATVFVADTRAVPADNGALDTTVRGSRVRTRWIDVGPTTSAADPTAGAVLEAIVAADAGVVRIPARGSADGTFAIAGVPLGPYVLHHAIGGDDEYVATSSRAVDLGDDVLGRADQAPATPGTRRTYVFTGGSTLDPDNDALLAYAANANAYELTRPGRFDVTYRVDAGPFATGMTVPVEGRAVLGTEGDRVTVVKMSTHSVAGGETYVAASQAFAAPAFDDVAGGGGAVVAGQFFDVATVPVRMRWFRSFFGALVGGMGPGARAVGQGIEVEVVPPGPAAMDVHPRGTMADALVLQESVDTGAVDFAHDLDLGTVGVANPYGAGALADGVVDFTAKVTATLPGADGGVDLVATVDNAAELARWSSDSLAPTLTPPRNLRVAGVAATTSRAGLPTSLSLAWDAPTKGAPRAYVVVVHALAAGAGGVTETTVATFHTEQTTLAIPDGVLAPGASYVFVVRAQDFGVLAGQRPYRAARLRSTADTVSATMTTAP